MVREGRPTDRQDLPPRLFEAWSDEPWVIDGAAVRVSLVCFSRADDAAACGARLDAAKCVGALAGAIARWDKALLIYVGRSFRRPVRDFLYDASPKYARRWLSRLRTGDW